jgi:hypothetical protein
MDIILNEITVRDLVKGFSDKGEQGVVGYNGLLDIRPPYQREFIYDEKEQRAVINTIRNNFPLNVMYWAKREDGTYEVLDGQQRTLSICNYVNGGFHFDMQYFHNLLDEEQNQILDYKLMVYICEGTPKEKLDWFTTINIAGKKLTNQELLNAVYAGPFVTDAKRYFSKTNAPAALMAKDLVNGVAIRQEILETALEWIAASQGLKMGAVSYMAVHQNDPNANQLWQYFNAVITWVTTNFNVSKRKKIMKGVNWGALYDAYKDTIINYDEVDAEVAKLILDSEVEKNIGIYPYVLSRNEKHLGLRAFPDDIALETYTKQEGICPHCGEFFDFTEMEADHIVPWAKGGKTVRENCQMLCRHCNRTKSDK